MHEIFPLRIFETNNSCVVVQVTVCKTGRECVHLLQNTPAQHQDTSSGHASPLPLFPFDLILKDHEPPLVDACRLLRRMARDPTLPAVPVVGTYHACLWH